MILEARIQSFKILSIVVFLAGCSFVGNCQAERNPVSLNSQNFCQNLIGADDDCEFAKAQLDRQRDEKRWSEIKLLARKQASLAKQKLASLEIGKWWQQLNARDVVPAVQQRLADDAEASLMTASAIAVNLAANTTATQWREASKIAMGLVDSAQCYVSRATIKLEADLQARLIQLVELASSKIVMPRIDGLIQAMTIGKGSILSSDDSPATESSSEVAVLSSSTDEDSPADPYWQYYSDCDFWGAQFEAAKE